MIDTVDVKDESVSIWDVILILVRRRRLIIKTTGIAVFLALILAIFSPLGYRSSIKIVPESAGAEMSGAGDLSLLRSFGISASTQSGELRPETYTDIIRSRYVLLEVSRTSFEIAGFDGPSVFTDYYLESRGFIKRLGSLFYRYSVGIPGRILRWIKNEDAPVLLAEEGEQRYPTRDEIDAMEYLNDLLGVKKDAITGIITISVITPDPRLSVDLVNALATHLGNRIRTIHSQKALENLEFIKARHSESNAALFVAEEAYASFVDENKNISSGNLSVQVDRLKRALMFKSQHHLDLSSQLTLAEIDLQRSLPVMTVMDGAIPAYEPSKPQRKLLVFLGILIGITLGVGFAFFDHLLGQSRSNESQRAKIDEIGQGLASIYRAVLPRIFGRSRK